MQKLVLILVFIFPFGLGLAGQTLLPFSISLFSQSEVDNFAINYPGDVIIGGNLTIGGGQNDITNLNGLSGVVAVQQSLTINHCNNLVDISGLSALTEVGFSLSITHCFALEHLHGLEHLSSVGLDLQIEDNDHLLSLSGLDHLTSVTNLTIKEHVFLVDISALSQLTTIQGYVILDANYSLTDLNGLHHITQIGSSLLISNNPFLDDLTGLESLNWVGELLQIYNNDELDSLIGLENLEMIAGSGNRGLEIVDNASLQNLSGLQNLQSITGICTIASNGSLTDLTALGNITALTSGLSIVNNFMLETLSGLDNLTYIGGLLYLFNNYHLANLASLAQLDSIGGSLVIWENPQLSDLNDLEGLAYIGGKIDIQYNDLLSDCDIAVVCNHFLQQGNEIIIFDNAPGCDSAPEVALACGGISVYTQVLADLNEDCVADSTDIPIREVQVRLNGPVQTTLHATNDAGVAWFGYLDDGLFSLTLPQFPTANWALCQDTVWVNPDTISGAIQASLLLKPLTHCPELALELGMPPAFRICLFTSDIHVGINNIGFLDAENIELAVVYPSNLLTIDSSSLPILAQSGDTLFFSIDHLPYLEGTELLLRARTVCDSVLLNQTICIEAFATMANACPITAAPSSEIRLQAQCIGDTTVRFTLTNIGDAPTQSPHEYIIIEDEVVLMISPFSLDPSASLHVDIPSGGATYRMEATKFDDGALTATAIENCGGFTPGFINAYWLDQDFMGYDIDCREVLTAYDPNRKTAIPTGVGEEHLLAANRSIQYTIEFQNTGSDTAYKVLLRDVLPAELDVNSFKPGHASHLYTWEIRGLDTLEVLFFPIALPDSNTNEPASHGFFTFELAQQPDLPDGTTIENSASIFFDFNPPILTNTVIHTIGQLVLSVDEPKNQLPQWRVAGNPMYHTATITAIQYLPGEKRFDLFDGAGRRLRSINFSGQSFIFERGSLNGGLYFFSITDARGQVSTGKIVLAE
ncbi:MAG TPA: hypothetical protein PKA00_03170 [Saprospiraceae bacterium]|nr:hypothetical protein [Saprospiraceae bacterium]HMQ81876.1 hypothetical protein [Saprospiraceae bacterium]